MIRAVFSTQTTNNHYYDEVYFRHRHRVSSPRTADEFRASLRRLDRFAGHAVTLGELCDGLLLDFRDARLEKGTGAATVNKDLRHLCALWRFAARKKILADAPDLDPLAQPERTPRGYSVEEFGRLLGTAASTPGIIPFKRRGKLGVPAGAFWYSLFGAFWDTGGRREAMLDTLFSDLNFSTGILDFKPEDQKTLFEQRFPLHAETLKAIDAIRSPARERIWHYPFCHTWFYSDVRRILKRAGLYDRRRKPIHGLRTSHATYTCNRLGLKAASEALGHSTEKVTRDSYIDPTLLDSLRSVDVMPRPTVAAKADPQRRLFD